ncbi:hypothetical protein [Streptomyces sp. NRRL S-350]|uniref:hypothetical protein n=1 Tax=Streptomyces sp. NRRL S-350 TaxID=1463902 RepID=UPI0004BF3748|nr:hypothetical protein [Streptomyces sp. NRRL S-350]
MTHSTDATAASEGLGALVSRHPVSTATRWVNAAWALPIGVLASWLGLWALLHDGDDGSSGGGRGLGVILGLGVCGLGIGLTQAVRALRGGAGEYFEVRENGLVHGNARGRRVSWAWSQVVSVTIPTRRGAAGALAQRFGNDYRCVIATAGGGRVRVDGLAADAPALGNAVIDHCPTAPLRTGEEWTRKAGGWLLLGSVLCVGGVIAIVRYISDHPETEKVSVDADGHTSYETVQGLDDTTLMLLGLGLAACGIAAIVCFALFVSGRVRRRR